MKVRMIGSIRVKKTVASPWRSNQRSAQSRCLRLMWISRFLLQQLEPTVVAGRVGDPRADEVAEHARGDDPEQGHVALVDVEAREQHDRLAGHRDAGALEQHQDEDARVAERVDDVDCERRRSDRR